MTDQPVFMPAAATNGPAIPAVEMVAPPAVVEPVPARVEDFDFVRLPDGQIIAVPKGDVHEAPATMTQNVPATALVEVVDPHNYVWLANGDVIRVKESDLPAPAGTNAPFGYWQLDDKVFLVVNVVPVEHIVAKGVQ